MKLMNTKKVGETKAPKKDHFDLENDTGRAEIGNTVEKRRNTHTRTHKRTHRHAHTTHTYIFMILEKIFRVLQVEKTRKINE